MVPTNLTKTYRAMRGKQSCGDSNLSAGVGVQSCTTAQYSTAQYALVQMSSDGRRHRRQTLNVMLLGTNNGLYFLPCTSNIFTGFYRSPRLLVSTYLPSWQTVLLSFFTRTLGILTPRDLAMLTNLAACSFRFTELEASHVFS